MLGIPCLVDEHGIVIASHTYLDQLVADIELAIEVVEGADTLFNSVVCRRIGKLFDIKFAERLQWIQLLCVLNFEVVRNRDFFSAIPPPGWKPQTAEVVNSAATAVQYKHKRPDTVAK